MSASIRGYRVTPPLFVTVETEKTVEECMYCRETARKAIDAIMATDPHELKKLVIEGLCDAHGYPLDYAGVDS